MIDTISSVLILMEKHGLSVLMNAIFIVVILTVLRNNQKNIVILIENITKLIVEIEEKIIKGQLHDDLIKVIVKNKWREFLKDYNKEIYLYMLKNNIVVNYSLIDNELKNMIVKQVYSLKVLIQDKTTAINTNKLCGLIKIELDDTHNLIMELLKELSTSKEYERDKEIIIRSLSSHFDKILDKGLNDIDNIDI